MEISRRWELREEEKITWHIYVSIVGELSECVRIFLKIRVENGRMYGDTPRQGEKENFKE